MWEDASINETPRREKFRRGFFVEAQRSGGPVRTSR